MASDRFVSMVGRWQVNEKETRRAEGADPKEHEIHIILDDGENFAFTEFVITEEGDKLEFSWSGPYDGQFRPTIGGGFEVAFTRPSRDSYAYEWRAQGKSGRETVTQSDDRCKLICKGFLDTPDGEVPNDFVFDRVDK